MDSAHIRIRETRRRHGGPTETLNGAAMAITGPRRWLTAVTAALALTGHAAIRDGTTVRRPSHRTRAGVRRWRSLG